MGICIRVVFTIMLFVIALVFLNVMEQSVVPAHAADLAVNQIKEDGSREQLRVEQNFQDRIYPFYWFVFACCIIMVWTKPIKNCIQYMIKT
jgi:hypothetical protein